VIAGVIRRDTECVPLVAPLIASSGVVVTRGTAAPLDDGGAPGWLTALRAHETISVPCDAKAEFTNLLLVQPPPVDDAPDELRLTVVDGRPHPALRLTPVAHYGGERVAAELHVDYDGQRIQASLPQPLVGTPDSTHFIRRDVAAERAFDATLHSLGVRREWSPAAQAQIPMVITERVPRIVRTLLEQGWTVDAAGVRYRQAGSVSMHVSSGIDWFELTARVDYDDTHASLPALLAAARRGDGFVTLDDGSIGLLPEDWLRKHQLLARLGTTEEDRLRFKPSQAALLDALLAAQPNVTCDDLFTRTRRELQSFSGVEPADPPSSFAGTLRPYQRDGLGWLLFLRRFGFGGCLADDMGLGKTVMVLALLARLRADRRRRDPRRPTLVVAPRSVVFNWRREAERFTPDLRVLDYTGPGRAAMRDQLDAHDIVLTTYGTLRKDAAHLVDVPFEYVVLDEAQAIKNASSASAKAARLLQAEHRLALSGTPVENHLGELWSLFEFLNPGLLGGSSAFERAGGRSLDEDAVAALARGLRPFILRRTKAQVARDLPDKTEQTLDCELERPQRLLYDQLRDHYRRTLLDRVDATGLARAKLQVLEALLRLRQAACHPGLIDAARKKDPSAKLDVLVPRLVEAVDEGHKTLVFSQFTSFLAILRERLDAEGIDYEYLDGRTRDRQSKVDRFQTDPGCRLFLISLKAGGLGLNLTAAEYVFLLDPWWNPAVEAQAIDRAHRIGQTRQVFAYRLIAKDTVEERVLELQQTKRRLADAILSADESIIRTLKKEDLELLLS
jgi:superfamily II DNA or RNA helicase